MNLPDLPLPSGAPVAGVPAPPGGAGRWQRQSPRMLLLTPVRTLGSFAVPLVLAVLGVRQGQDEDPWWLLVVVAGAALAVVFGVVSWSVTRYRFTDEQVQLRSGVLSRRVTTAPLDRVRSVDIEAPPLHRVLGLAKVKVGTGVDATRLELDGVSAAQATDLRTYLLARSHVAGGDGAAVPPPDGAPSREGAAYPNPAQPETELARIDWGWLRYAPFSLSSLVVVAGVFGVLAQFGDELPVDQLDVAQEAWRWVVAQALLALVGTVVLVIVVGWVIVSTLTYVLTWWNLRVVREGRGNLRISRGLLTTHSQTVERAKVRGARMGEPFLLRLVRGAELSAIATGVGSGGTTRVLPPAPRSVVVRVGHELLEEDGPLTMTLVGHGPRARRRIHVRHQWATLLVTGLLAVPTYLLQDLGVLGRLPGWGPPGVLVALGLLNALLAESTWRNLGHGLTDRHLVVQTGAVLRTREVLERAGIIGWRVEQGFFQRRLGLADLMATTAAGSEVLTAPDIPLDLAVQLARDATPGMLDDFLV